MSQRIEIRNLNLTANDFQRDENDYGLTFLLIEKLILNPLHALTSVSGVITNVLNLVGLTGLKVQSRSNIGVIALSITDLFMSATEMVITVSYFLSYVYPNFPFDLRSMVSTLLGWIRYPGIFISSWITTYLSVERCVSVVSPFRAKDMLSANRSIAFILIVTFLYMAIVYQIFAALILSYKELPSSMVNSSKDEHGVLSFSFIEDTTTTEMTIDIVCSMFLSLLSQAILILCTAWMIYALKSSSTVRRQSCKDKLTDVQHKGLFNGSALSEKERRLIKVTLCLALVITGFNVPRYIIVIVYYSLLNLEPAKYPELSFCLWIFSDFLISLYSSCNFFVYFKLNRKFRQRLHEMFPVRELNFKHFTKMVTL